MLVDIYNSWQKVDDLMVKEGMEDMEINIKTALLHVDLWTQKKEKAININSANFKFNIQDDKSIYAYSAELDSLIALAEQHYQLPIIKLKKSDFYSNSVKLSRKLNSKFF